METGSTLDVVADAPQPARRAGWRAGHVPPEVAFATDEQGKSVLEELLLPHIEKACAHSGGRFTPRGCVDRWLSGQWDMWAINNPANACVAVFFTAVNHYPDTDLRILEVCLLGGSDIKAWTHLEPILLEFARANNCTRVEAWSRSGLSKMLPEWKRSFVIERDV